MLKILLLLPLAIAILPCVHAIDMWSTDYHVGFSLGLLDNDSALAVTTVCDSLITWGQGSYQEPHHDSVESVVARARALLHTYKDHVASSLLLCHSKHMWLPAAGASTEHTLQLSNLLGISLWECSHYSGARVAFKLAETVLSNMSSSGRDGWTLEVDIFDGSEALMPAPAAVLLNAARVAADAWDFAAALDFIERSKILQQPPLPLEPASPAAKARASALLFSNEIVGLRNKSGHLLRVSAIVSHVLNVSSVVRDLQKLPTSPAALQSPTMWEGLSPDTNLKRNDWPPRLVECMMQDLMAALNLSNSNSVIDAAVVAIDSLVSIRPEGQTVSAICTTALQTGIVDLLLKVVASSRARSFHHASAMSALGRLVACDGSLAFITSYGIEVMSSLIRHGSKTERTSAAKIMKDVAKNVVSMIERFVIQAHVIYRTVFRFTLGMAPLDIYHRQQAGTSVKSEDALIKTLKKKAYSFPCTGINYFPFRHESNRCQAALVLKQLLN